MAQQDPWKAHNELTVIYAGEDFPTTVTKSLFLAGPTSRDPKGKSWRPDAIKVLRDLGYDGHVFAPENRETGPYDFQGQVEWEAKGLNMADTIVFWVPRDMKTLPGLTTNVEWGTWANSGKAVFGAPDDAENMRYLKWQCDQYKVPTFSELESLLEHTVKALGEGSYRTGGASKVPLYVWKNDTFQGWYNAQTDAGNRLDDAKVLWTFRVGPQKEKVFCWALHVDVYVTSEGRSKKNEFVLGRTDIACVALYCKMGANPKNYPVILVREFRSPGRTLDGFITELPAGSLDADDDKTAALKELKEETGFALEPERLQFVSQRQVAGTLSAHTASLFVAAITPTELAEFKSTQGEVRGVEADGERTTVAIATYGELLLGEHDLDWSTIGMISAAILK
jgi:8-oxo-dGTP pyrophosphatase MutT (NUDIX family)